MDSIVIKHNDGTYIIEQSTKDLNWKTVKIVIKCINTSIKKKKKGKKQII